MKRISFLLLFLISNLSFISCTEESLEDSVSIQQDHNATDGEDDKTDLPEDPIGG